MKKVVFEIVTLTVLADLTPVT